jgi:hypothetical protein
MLTKFWLKTDLPRRHRWEGNFSTAAGAECVNSIYGFNSKVLLTFKCLGFKSPVVSADQNFLMAFKHFLQWLGKF